MAAVDISQLTLLELARRQNPSGGLAQIVEVLAQTNDILKDAIWLEANNTASHITTRRQSLPSGTMRKINGGVAASIAPTERVEEPIGMLEDYSEVDKTLALMSGNVKAFRSQEDAGHVEGLAQSMASQLIYGDRTTAPENITGLFYRPDYDALADAYVYDNAGGSASATSNKTSLWIIQWGVTRVHLVYPKGDPNFGIQMTDLGEVTLTESSDATKKYQGYRTHFKVHFGLVIRDPRCVRRIVNISTSAIDQTDDFALDPDYVIQALNDLPYGGAGAVIYGNQTALTMLDIASAGSGMRSSTRPTGKSNVNFDQKSPWGMELPTFRGVPVRRVDQILNTEAYET